MIVGYHNDNKLQVAKMRGEFVDLMGSDPTGLTP
jgi:hypothetical protein